MSLETLDDFRTRDLTYTDTKRQACLLDYFYKCFTESKFTDITISVENQTFHCHKLILEANCPYFCALFSFEDSIPNHHTLNGLAARGFAFILDFFYRGSFTIDKDNVLEILQCSDFLQLRDIALLCSSFLMQHIKLDNCLYLYKLADSHSLFPLREKCWKFMLQNWMELDCRDVYKLSMNSFFQFINSKELSVKESDKFIEMVEGWKMENVQKVGESYTLSPDGFTYSDENSLMVEKDENDSMHSEMVSLSLKEENGILRRTTPFLTEVIVVVSRDTNPMLKKSKKDVYFYHPTTKEWQTLTTLPFDNRCLYSVCSFNNNIYVIGGIANQDSYLPFEKFRDVTDDVWCFDVECKSWKEKKPIILPRYNHSCIVYHEKLYVIGGRGEMPVPLEKHCERYCSVTDQWTFIAQLQNLEGIGNAALVIYNDVLHVIGGSSCKYDHRNKEVSFHTYSEAQAYDDFNDTWKMTGPLTKCFKDQQLVLRMGDCHEIEGFLLFLNSSSPVKPLKLFNPVKEELYDFILPQGFHNFAGSVVCQKKLVCTGGVESKFRAHDLVHYFDLSDPNSSWKMMTPLPVTMSHHSTFTIFMDLPTM